MIDRGLLPYSKSYSCKLLAVDPTPHQHALSRRLPHAPQDAYLAVDLVNIPHEGPRIEAVDRHHSTSDKAVVWGHLMSSSALVAPGIDPFLLRSDPYPTARMSTATYPCLTPTEALLNVVGEVTSANYALKGVLVDAQFTTRLGLRSLKYITVGIIGRFRTNNKVMYEAEMVKVRELAERFPPGVARWYAKFGRYVKRLKVVIPEVGEVDLLIIWKAQGTGWYLSVLISTVKAGIQEILSSWLARWSLEVSHRLRKQALGWSACQCCSFAAQLMHADLVIEAFNRVRQERARSPGLSWKEAQKVAALRLRNALLTEETRRAA